MRAESETFSQFEQSEAFYHASNGHCQKDRRTGPGGHTEGDQAHLAHKRGGPVTYNIYSFEDGGSDLQAGRPIETGVGEAQKSIRRLDLKDEWGSIRSTA